MSNACDGEITEVITYVGVVSSRHTVVSEHIVKYQTPDYLVQFCSDTSFDIALACLD